MPIAKGNTACRFGLLPKAIRPSPFDDGGVGEAHIGMGPGIVLIFHGIMLDLGRTGVLLQFCLSLS